MDPLGFDPSTLCVLYKMNRRQQRVKVVQVLWRRKASVTVLYCYYGHYMLLDLGEIHLYIMQKAHLNLS